MRRASNLPAHPAWWSRHQQALHLFRELTALHRVYPYLERGTLAWRRLEREQGALEAAIEALRQQAQAR
jgi:hypothetical protein